MADLKIFTDGGSRGNPGDAGIGIIIYDQSGQSVLELGEYIGTTTNNVAEYKALIKALGEAENMGAAEIEVFADSELMVKQVKGIYKVKSEGLLPLYQEVKSLIRNFKKFTITHVLRSSNKEADKMVNAGIDSKSCVEKRLNGTNASPVITSSIFAEENTAHNSKPAKKRDLAVGKTLSAVEYEFKKGAVATKQQQKFEQICYVVKGKVKYILAGTETILNERESLAIQGNYEYNTEALEDSIVVSVSNN